MAAFTKENLHRDGDYVYYAPNGNKWDRKNHVHIARMRMGAAGTFMTHLRKNWAVEDFFAQREMGKTPLDVVRMTGYLMPHIKRWLKEDGFPQTVDGYEAWKIEQAKN